ncbi:RDD family protein [Olsenella sp. Marseille-P4559]|uniref:RDD family protein n=1 Tax=Olsenella sp. Marseille-P4559 TaxID=2364795 RepID=UPI0013EF4DDB|nr:RDD family protein [Olsenella sp. Marseille-P4559]
MAAKKNANLSKRQSLVDTSASIPWSRIGAYAIDWTASGVLIGLPEVVVFNVVSGTHDMFSDVYVFSAMGLPVFWAYLCAFLSLAVFLFYYVWVPLKIYPGQTLGKHACHLRIARCDGSELSVKTLFIRQVLGLLLIESSATIMGSYLRQALTLASGFYVDGILAYAGSILLMISAVMVVAIRGQRAIHDYLAGTCVVESA